MNKQATYILILFNLITYLSFGKKPINIEELKNDLELVWPLAQTVKIEYELTTVQLHFYNTKAEREQFIKEFEHFIKDKYFSNVLELNMRQGKLLLLLIDRELGKTSYDLLKEYLGNQRAQFWQRFANLLGANLKEKYIANNNPIIENEIHQLLKKGNATFVFH